MYNNLNELFQNYENRTLSIMTQIDEILKYMLNLISGGI